MYSEDMSNAKNIETIEALALETGVTVQFYNSTKAALGQGNGDKLEADKVQAAAKSTASLVHFRNALAKSGAAKSITKIAASAGYWNMGRPGDVSYSRVVTL